MKYNKQLFDHIAEGYNKTIYLGEFIFDNLIEQQENITRFEVMENFDLYVQATLAKVIIDQDPKNPSLFNMLKKLNKYATFYQGVGLDDWFNAKSKVINNIKKKAKNCTTNIPVVIQIVQQIDEKTKRSEFSMQLLEALIDLVLLLIPDKESFEDVENDVINKYFKNIYEKVPVSK